MKILYVSYYFPPFNTMGGIRARGQVLELMNQGHDVLVITAKYQGRFSKNLELNPKLKILFFGNEVIDSNDDVTKQTRNSFKQKLLSLSKSNAFINFLFTFRILIEEMIGYKAQWKKEIIKNYQKIQDWAPDLIFGSFSPWSSILVSRKLSGMRK